MTSGFFYEAIKRIKKHANALIYFCKQFICQGKEGAGFLTRQPYYGLKQPQISLEDYHKTWYFLLAFSPKTLEIRLKFFFTNQRKIIFEGILFLLVGI